jgi:bifunctional NMN adenylyltransferase/nudix hydrolase
MLKEKEAPSADVGVIVARFQVAELHEGHKELLDTIKSRHDKVIVFLGLSPAKSTVNNPLDFEARKQMILEDYPDVIIMYVKDQLKNEVWSKLLDEKIGDLVTPEQSVALYGSRDSFIPCYKGRYTTIELEQNSYVSGRDERKKISNKVKSSEDFRKGAIWSTTNQWPKAMPTIDVAILTDKKDKLLLARKPNETKYRFVGGFVEPGHNLEQTVRKEAQEETHLEVDGIEYVGSMFMDDWRYRNERDKIVTTFFTATIVFGRPEPDDDIEEVRFFDIKNKNGTGLYVDLEGEKIVDGHTELMKMLEERLSIE